MELTHKRIIPRVIHLVLLAACGLASANPSTTQSKTEATTEATTQPTTKPADTSHEITLAGHTLHYHATASEIPLTDDEKQITAHVFYVAYEKTADGTTQPTTEPNRPITFIFNGGPGAASVWLHLGTAGPRRIVLPADGMPPSPPYALTDNAESWLDLTDLVFIDPVGTGFSRADSPDGAKMFYSTHGDVESIGDFIRLYCTKHDRWLSPKYLAGESYGTTRAAALAEHLHGRYGIDLSGIVLISTVLNFQTISFSAGNDAPYPLYLPTYTAVAHYHHKLSPALQADFHKTLADASQWAQTTYAAALARGSSLDADSRQKVTAQLAAFTGLPESYVSRSNMRIAPERFEQSLLIDEHKVVGRFDGRITGDELDPLNDSAESDPSLDGYLGVFSDTINDYLRRDLKFETDVPYEVLSPHVAPWDFEAGRGTGGYLNVAPQLARALTATPSLRVLICCGYYDLATPFATVDQTVNAMPLSPEMRGHITEAFFESGHMIYLNPKAREQLKTRLNEFYSAH